jgi:hypothetical protein
MKRLIICLIWHTPPKLQLCSHESFTFQGHCKYLALPKKKPLDPHHDVQQQDPTVVNGFVECPECHSSLRVGSVGIQNLYKRHIGSTKCKENKLKYKDQQSLLKTQSAARRFFAPRAPNVPPTVIAPPRIHATSLAPPKPTPALPRCSIAHKLLVEFRNKIDTLPPEVRDADDDHPLARFSGDPTGCVEDGVDAWEQFDGPLNNVLQTSPEGLKALVRKGEKGLSGLHRLLEYLVNYHGIKGALLEMKLDRLMKAMSEV